MSKREATHPDDVLDALLQGCAREQKRQNLRRLHELCAAQHAGSKDFSLPVIGKLWEAAGGIKARALYNAPSEDYRTLIQAWETHAGPVEVRAVEPKGKASHSFLTRIDDPAIRALVQGALIERDKLQAEVNLLKSLTQLNLDRSPALPNPVPSHSPMLAPPDSTAKLTPSEREALERAISSDFLSDQGWSEGRSGEVMNEKGRRIFESGFTRAIRKVLAK
ncbi:MAG: alpha/beta hydrolase [Burkholderiales bacterium]|nr:alpha/beta hydrolase [Burkholderiales bacterium]